MTLVCDFVLFMSNKVSEKATKNVEVITEYLDFIKSHFGANFEVCNARSKYHLVFKLL